MANPYILMVEDDPIASRLVCDALLGAGYRVVVLGSVTQALAALTEQCPDLLLLDYLLPDGTAETLIDTVRATRGAPPPFILMTGAGDERLAVAMMKRGARDYLVKDARLTETLPLVVARVLRELHTEAQLRQAQQVIFSGEEQLRCAFEQAAVGMALCDLNGCLQRFNRKYQEITGCGAEGVVGQTYQELTHPDDQLRQQELTRSLVAGEIPSFELQKRYQSKGGGVCWAKTTVTLIRDQAGAPLQLFGVVEDLSILHQNNQKLQHLQLQMLQAQDAGKFHTFELDLASGRIDWTPQTYVLLERPAGSVEQTLEQWFALVHPDDQATLQLAIGRVLAGSETQVEYRLLMPDGRSKPVITYGTVKRADDGSPLGILGVTQDQSDFKRYEAGLREARDRAETANRAKSAFLANMSHELRTPLNGVLGMLQLLETTVLDTEQEEYVRLAASSGWSLLNLLNDILDLSRVEAGRLELRVEPFDLRDLIDYCLHFFHQEVDAKRLALTKVVAAEIPAVLCGDALRVRQILFNLIGNAIKFTPQGGVQVTVVPVDSPAPGQVRLRLVVADSGIGIAPEMLSRVWEPFTQEEGPYQRRFQGTGLGLSIVKRLAELMNGGVSIESHPGRGTEVAVTFEVANAPLPAPEAVSDVHSASGTSAGAGLRILVAEDNPVNQKTLTTLLRKAGHTVAAVGNGQELLVLLSQQPFDLVVLDVQMPRMDGLEALRHIRSDRSDRFDPEIPVIGLTACTMEGDREAFLAAGMTDCLDKPLHWNELKSLLVRFTPPVAAPGSACSPAH